MSALLPALPFVAMLLCIALLPLAAPRFWDRNRNKAVVAAAFGAPMLIWGFLRIPDAMLKSLEHYASFIVLLFSLYVISGGIALHGEIRGTPRINTFMLLAGAMLANVIGTTGASMVLIRPFLRANRHRHHRWHLPVFFIIIVSNCGGLLTPLGDPPLFLGYLSGVPFFWTLRMAPIWALTVGLTCAAFLVWEMVALRHEERAAAPAASGREPLRITGWQNLIFLGVVVSAVFLQSPWRELDMLLATAGSLLLGPKAPRRDNQFTWHPIEEVAILFAGIFVTMAPALVLLQQHAGAIRLTEPWHFFWVTGALSSFLDNAPTYATFLALAQSIWTTGDVVGLPSAILTAISAGAVFMGANSYIGNGPNFMVKAIADHRGFRTPSFFGYMFYTALIMVPIYLLLTWLFFR